MNDILRRLAAAMKIPLEGEGMLADLVDVLKQFAQRALSSDAAQEIQRLFDEVVSRHAPAATEEPAPADSEAAATP